MAEDSAIRLENFRRLWPQPFSPTVAQRKLWGSASLWSDLYHGRKSFGEKIARRIESHLQLVRMSLDDPDGPKFQPISAELMDRLLALPRAEQRTAENLLRIHLQMPALPADGADEHRLEVTERDLRVVRRVEGDSPTREPSAARRRTGAPVPDA